jgi:hypothetical protein
VYKAKLCQGDGIQYLGTILNIGRRIGRSASLRRHSGARVWGHMWNNPILFPGADYEDNFLTILNYFSAAKLCQYED